MNHTFVGRSDFHVGAALPEFTQDQVQAEPMLFSCEPMFAYENGGPITRAFLDAVSGGDPDGLIGVLDTRVHMLMPGMTPCIGGWHLDDVPRTRSDGQPDLRNPDVASHVLALVNGDVAPTEFYRGDWALPEVEIGDGNVYHHYDRLLTEGQLGLGPDADPGEVVKVPTNRLIHFDSRTFHRGTPADTHGWRWFGRLSHSPAATRAGRKPRNQIRTQVQVYVESFRHGW